MKKILFLDDMRNPHGLIDGKTWVETYSPIQAPYEIHWVKKYDEFVGWITNNGLPDAILFDHDLGFTNEYYIENNLPSPEPDKTGYDCAKWLVEYCLDNKLKLPPYNIQSANPVGKENIDGLLKSFNKFNNK